MSFFQAFSATLFAAFMWGSWLQFLKRIGKWPLQYFMFYLYFFSLFVTWGALIFFDPQGFKDLLPYLAQKPKYLLFPLLGGVLYTMGMWYNMVAVSQAGLAVTMLIFSSIGIVVGTGMSALLGGLPPEASSRLIGLGAVAILGAIVLTIFMNAPMSSGNKGKKILGLSVISGLLITAFPTFMTLGIRPALGEDGLGAFQYMALLSLGSLIAVAIVNIAYPPKDVPPQDRSPRPHYFLLAALSAFAHYGGNVLQATASPYIGMAIAWPLGQSMVLWGIFWGFLYGEFKDAKPRVYFFLSGAIALFCAGAYFFTIAIYH